MSAYGRLIGRLKNLGLTGDQANCAASIVIEWIGERGINLNREVDQWAVYVTPELSLSGPAGSYKFNERYQIYEE